MKATFYARTLANAFGNKNIFNQTCLKFDFGPPKCWFGASPESFNVILGPLFHVYFLDNRESDGEAQLPKSHFSAPEPFQHRNLWPARCGLVLQLGYIYIYIYMKKNQKLNQKCIAKVVRENICKKHAEKATHVISGCHFESIWNIRSCPGTFFATYFSKLWGGIRLDRFWPTLGHPWSNCLNLLAELRSNFAPNVKHSKVAITTSEKTKIITNKY